MLVTHPIGREQLAELVAERAAIFEAVIPLTGQVLELAVGTDPRTDFKRRRTVLDGKSADRAVIEALDAPVARGQLLMPCSDERLTRHLLFGGEHRGVPRPAAVVLPRTDIHPVTQAASAQPPHSGSPPGSSPSGRAIPRWPWSPSAAVPDRSCVCRARPWLAGPVPGHQATAGFDA